MRLRIPTLAAQHLAFLIASTACADQDPFWNEITPAPPTPPSRTAHVAVLDSARDRVIVFGGIDLPGLRNDVWALSFDPAPAWTQLAPAGTGPSGRWDHAAAYDPIGDRILVFGGLDDAPRNDVWALSLSEPITWSELQPTGTPPAGRSSHTVVFDPQGNRLLVHGGHDGTMLRSDLWELSLDGAPAWNEIATSGTSPSARRDAIAAYDPVRLRYLLHGGNAGVAPFQNDAWALDLAGPPAWTLLEPTNSAPDGGVTHAGAYDAARDRLVTFGGNYHNQTWALSLDGALEWQQLQPDGPLPPGRIDHTFVYRETADQFVVFAGQNGLAIFDDTWILASLDATRVPESARNASFRLSPNPATHEIQVRIDGEMLDAGGRIAIYDLAGREVARLPLAIAGTVGTARWDLRGASGARAAAGMYVCKLDGRRAGPSQRFVILH